MTRSLFAAVSLCSALSSAQVFLPWTIETTPITSTRAGDPAFFSAADADGGLVELVVGTDTAQLGVYAWAPSGTLGQVLPIGLARGADSRGSLLVVSQPSGVLAFFTAAPDGGLMTRAPDFPVSTPANVALGDLGDGGLDLWFDTSDRLQHYKVLSEDDGGLTLVQVGAELVLPQVASGLALDERSGLLYVAQPSLGVLVVNPDDSMSFVLSIDGGQLGAGPGGLDVYLGADGSTWLFTALPSEEAVALHALGSSPTSAGPLSIGPRDGGSERVRLPTHLDVTQRFPGFDGGALIVQDGVSGNYKIAALADLPIAFPEPWAADVDGGAADGGSDGGLDGGALDGGADAGRVGGGGIPGGGPAPGETRDPPACGCAGAPLAILPALLLLWWIRRPRS